MIYCQACGAENTADSRFCNMCGAKIAREGEAGGPIGQTTPPTNTAPLGTTTTGGGAAAGAHTTMSGSTVSLAAIGVRTPGQTWAILVGGALAAFLLGGVAMFVLTRPSEHAAADPTEAPAPDDGDGELVVGDLTPEDEALPEGVDIVATPEITERPTPRPRAGAGGRSSTGATRGSSGGGSASTGGGGGGGSASSGGGGSASSGGASSGGGSASSGGASSGGGGASSGGGGAASGESGGGEPAGGGSTDWDRFGGGEDEVDYEMEEYTAHIRRMIRSFYIRQAQSCFDHASRVGEAVRGTVVVAFTIAASGEVEDTRVTRNTTGDEALGACVARRVDDWRFPVPPRDEPLAMQMPFSR